MSDRLPQEPTFIPTFEDHHELAMQLATAAREVVVSTYNVHAGIASSGKVLHEWGGSYESKTFVFLSALPAPARILVGRPREEPCHKDCKHCKDLYADKNVRREKHEQHFKQHQWRDAGSHHFKLLAFRIGDDWHCITGGRNLTDSSWCDGSVYLPPGPAASALVRHFETAWARAQRVFIPGGIQAWWI